MPANLIPLVTNSGRIFTSNKVKPGKPRAEKQQEILMLYRTTESNLLITNFCI